MLQNIYKDLRALITSLMGVHTYDIKDAERLWGAEKQRGIEYSKIEPVLKSAISRGVRLKIAGVPENSRKWQFSVTTEEHERLKKFFKLY